MDAVILAAGLGTRMRPLTLKTPKPLLVVGDKTILEHTLEVLPSEIDRVVLVVNYLAEQIKKKIGSARGGRPIEYVEHKDLGGTGAALSAARTSIRSEKFMVLMGDDLYNPDDLRDVARQDYAILVKEVTEPGRFGSVVLNKDGNIVAIREAGDGTPTPPYLINCAVYVMDKTYFDLPARYTPKNEIGLPQTMVQLAKLSVEQGGPRKIIPIRTREWYSIGTPEELRVVRALPKFSKKA